MLICFAVSVKNESRKWAECVGLCDSVNLKHMSKLCKSHGDYNGTK